MADGISQALVTTMAGLVTALGGIYFARNLEEKIERETGAVVHDWQVIEPVPNSMFSDTTHLNRYRGASVFTRFLAEQYADQFGAPGD